MGVIFGYSRVVLYICMQIKLCYNSYLNFDKNNMRLKKISIYYFFITIFILFSCENSYKSSSLSLEEGFKNPPLEAKSGVYWYFMDGCYSREGITKDLESMVDVGINHIVFLEVKLGGVPRGEVDLLSVEWMDMFKHIVEECERLDVEITLGVGPGWSGSGGPWVDPEGSMQHLVASSKTIVKSGTQTISLPLPDPMRPYFGGRPSEDIEQIRSGYYEDVAVLAYPTPAKELKLEPEKDADEKALFYRGPYSSVRGVKQYLPMYAEYPDTKGVSRSEIIDLTSKLKSDGTLVWDVPEGKWTIMRFVSRNNGSVTRPAPLPGLGLEADKFDTLSMSKHIDKFVGGIFRHVGFKGRDASSPIGGFTMLHMDSWEMGAQNWTQKFREEFTKRRGYDPLLFFPVYEGVIVENQEMTERFLWDLRLTSQELIIENHATYIRNYAKRYGLGLTIEPYDMTPTSDLELGAVATVPMAEFWAVGFGYNTTWAPYEATSIAHIKGVNLVPAEAFTSWGGRWTLYPGNMKDQTDWAFATGINRLVFHTFQHQSLDDKLKPGMTMGPHGVHWNRNQTWWDMGRSYHDYVSRCQFLLQQGTVRSDILYLSPEGSPHVFRAPNSALEQEAIPPTKAPMYGGAWENKMAMPDKRGYGFDATPPSLLYTATVKDGNILFPSGASYEVLVLPVYDVMTPELLAKIKSLIEAGATVIGMPPLKSPSLVNYPECDSELGALVKEMWGEGKSPETLSSRSLGKGELIWGDDILRSVDNLYPHYDITAKVLENMDIKCDFATDAHVRYTHRTLEDGFHIYFVSNRAKKSIEAECNFRIEGMKPELWDALTGDIRDITTFSCVDGITTIPMVFETDQSFFVIFREKGSPKNDAPNFEKTESIATLDSAWRVEFDPEWGGPKEIIFENLIDWTEHSDEGIKYYSGSAFYNQIFEFDSEINGVAYLDLGKVNVMARVWLNGVDVGIVWTYPWRVDITNALKRGENSVKIEVVNLWENRLIGDSFYPFDGIENGEWPEWVLKGEPRPSKKRYTFTSFTTERGDYKPTTPLSRSGLVGPVTIRVVTE